MQESINYSNASEFLKVGGLLLMKEKATKKSSSVTIEITSYAWPRPLLWTQNFVKSVREVLLTQAQ